jgi:hypothetical protein
VRVKQPPLPRQIQVKDAVYTVIFVHEIKGGDMGGCDGVNRLIFLSLDQTREEMLASFYHELLHAIEFEYRVKLGHPKIERLEWDLARIHPVAASIHALKG